MLSARLSILLGCAVGFCLRRFFFCFATFITPFLIIIIYLNKYIFKMEYCTNLHKYICAILYLHKKPRPENWPGRVYSIQVFRML